VRPTVGVGGQDGVISSGDEPLRQTGVVSYGWNEDGSALWYLCAAPTPPGAPDDAETQGVVYDPELTKPADFSTPVRTARLELHVLEVASGEDRLVAARPGSRALGERVFQPGRVAWHGPDRLVYDLPALGPGGLTDRTLVFGADALRLDKSPSGTWRLSEAGPAGQVRRDLGSVDFVALGGWLGAWRSPDGRALFGVLGQAKFGLFSYPRSAGGDALAATTASLSHCSFDAALIHGVCAEEGQTEAPRLVAVSPASGDIHPLADPNLRYGQITPLRVETFTWTNARGHRDWGWVTYPRGYRAGQRYPAIVITHASDARNTFADPAFQWCFPLQVLAERGYVVISANERLADTRAAPAGWGGDDGGLPAKRVQAAFGLEAVANMEAAANVWIDRGVADPKRLGIAGYSRGAIVTTLTMSQSRLFRAGIAADTNLYNANGYWEGGQIHRIYLNLFGGSPFDPKAIANYRAFSPSLRAARFSGPLLQLFTGYSAPTALQLDRALRDAKVPTELVAYVGETHLFHRPLAQLSAMVRSLGWFDDKLP
jgi:dipeptidyl aminopeptidase/acylaminoacyl peptidase